MTEEKLEESSLVDTNFGRSDGSEVIFLGITRDNNFDRNVSKLFYESYQDMALLEIEKIIFEFEKCKQCSGDEKINMFK